MRNRVFSPWTLAVLMVLGACVPAVEGNPSAPPGTGLNATPAGGPVLPSTTGLSAALEVPAQLPDGNSVIVRFAVTNNAEADRYLLKWYTPLEGIGGEIFSVERDGQAIPYTGILAMRGDPTPDAYQLLEAGKPVWADVDLAGSFDFSQPGSYSIEFLSPRISHVARSEAEMARSVDDLGPVDIPSNPVTVRIGGSSTEPAAGVDRAHYQGTSPQSHLALPFEIGYSPSLWDFVPADGPDGVDRLLQRHTAGCSLQLGEGPVAAPPVPPVSLAGRDWQVHQVQPKLLQYSTMQDGSFFGFGLALPDPYSGGAKDPCRQAAEDVLETLRVALPHSTKGYELYSWYEEREGHWSYTLVTGTNRLKTIEEFRARESYVQPGGWVSITAGDDAALKTALRRLPRGERVTWIGAEWLKQVGADEAMAGTMRLPDAATVAGIEDFCRELGLHLHVAAAPDAVSQPAPSPPVSRTVLPKETSHGTGVSRLVIREVPIVAAVVDGPGHLAYDDRLGDEVLARIKELRDRSARRALARTNAALAPFGYRLETRFDAGWNRTLYDLYREDEAEALLPGLSALWDVPLNASVNASGTDFALVVENAPDTLPLYPLVTSQGLQTWDSGERWALPGYVGDDLARVTRTAGASFTYRVELGTRIVYTGTAALYGAHMPLRSFTTWADHWVLEVDDRLIMDGQDAGQALGYDAAFGFSRLGDRSFYFFEQNGLVGLSYGGQVLPELYGRVFHNGCCEAAIHNVAFGPDAVWFHALREGIWYWVEVRAPAMSGADRGDDELARQALMDFFEHLRSGRYEEASQLYGGSYDALIDHNPTVDPQDHAALLKGACTTNGFQCLRVRRARLQEDVGSGAAFRFVTEFSTLDGELYVRGPCCGASEAGTPPESAFVFTVAMSRDGTYRVQDLPTYVP